MGVTEGGCEMAGAWVGGGTICRDTLRKAKTAMVPTISTKIPTITIATINIRFLVALSRSYSSSAPPKSDSSASTGTEERGGTVLGGVFTIGVCPGPKCEFPPIELPSTWIFVVGAVFNATVAGRPRLALVAALGKRLLVREGKIEVRLVWELGLVWGLELLAIAGESGCADGSSIRCISPVDWVSSAGSYASISVTIRRVTGG